MTRGQTLIRNSSLSQLGARPVNFRTTGILVSALVLASISLAVDAQENRVELSIEFNKRAGKNTPVRSVVDFDQLLGKKPRLIDPYSLEIVRQTGSRSRTYPVRFSEDLLYRNRGWIAWLVDNPRQPSKWFLQFKMRAPNGRMVEPGYLPPVGVGDELAYNGSKWRSIDSPGYHACPIPVDWNNDGLIDILSRSHGANHLGRPMAGIFYWRNIGSNKRPKFAPPLRLYAEGVNEQQTLSGVRRFRPRRDFISEDYVDCDVFDWFGNGRLDLITLSRTGGIKVYRNTGRIDRVGLPILKLAQRPKYPTCLARGRYPRLRVVDWDGSGRPSLMIGTLWKGQLNGKRQILRQIGLMRAVDGSNGNWKFESAPLGTVKGRKTFPQDWRKYSNFESERPWYFDVVDIDNDGKKELVCGRRWNDIPAMELWRNVGSVKEPVMKFDAELPWFTHNGGFTFRFVTNKAFRGCLIAGIGWGMRYFERVDSNTLKLDAFRPRGQLVGLGCRLKLRGYVRPVPFDADNNGTMDLLCGDEPGRLTLVRNVGTKQRPIFAAPQLIKNLHGVPLVLSDTNLFPKSRSRSYIGQVKPFLCDWDSDGKLDIIVSGGTFDDIYWLKNYNPATNRYREKQVLQVKGGTVRPFVIRKGPAVVDWNGDGKPELLAVSRINDAISLFRQSKKRPDMLQFVEPLRYQDGKLVEIKNFLPYGNITLWPCDWTGTKASDLIVASNHFTWLVENVGTNAKPVFKKPVRFKSPDRKPIETSHHENHAAAYDWDGDGRLDLMVGGESGTIYLFHRDWLDGITHKVSIRKGEAPAKP